MDKAHQSLQIIVVALGVLAPCILLAGYSYYLGHITTFGIDSSLMNRGFGDVIAESWIVGVRLLVYLWSRWWWLVLFFGFAIIGALGALIFVVRQKSKGIDALAKKINKEYQGRTILGFTQWHWLCLGEVVGTIWNWSWAVVALVMFASAVVILPFHHGNFDAQTQIMQYQKNGCADISKMPEPFSCIYLIDISSSDDVPVTQGFLVTANNERVAIFNKNGLEVWPLLDSYMLRRKYGLGEE